MAKRRKRLTPNQEEFNKQVRRIKKAIKKIEIETGLQFPYYTKLEKPKRITKQKIAELKKIKPAQLRKFQTQYYENNPTQSKSNKPQAKKKQPSVNQKWENISMIDEEILVISNFMDFVTQYAINIEVRDAIVNLINELQLDNPLRLAQNIKNLRRQYVEAIETMYFDSDGDSVVSAAEGFIPLISEGFSGSMAQTAMSEVYHWYGTHRRAKKK